MSEKEKANNTNKFTDEELFDELKSRGFDISNLLVQSRQLRKEPITVDEWIEYLDKMDDVTCFNQEIISDIYYVIVNAYKEGKYNRGEEDKHFKEIKSEVKEIVMHFDCLRNYFNIKCKKDIQTLNLEKYYLD